MLNPINVSWKGYCIALLTIMFLSAATLLAKFALNFSLLNFYSVAIWGWVSGMFMATCVFYVPIKSQRQNLWPEIKRNYSFFGIISALAIVSGNSWFYSLSQINGGVFGLIEQNTILWSFLFGILFLGEKFNTKQVVSIGMTLLGFGLVSTLQGEVNILGILGLIIFGSCLALQSLIIKKQSDPFSPFALNFCRGWSMALGSWVIFSALGLFQYNIEPLALGIMCLSQFLGIFLGRVAYIYTHQYFPISQISLLMLGMSIITLFGSWLWLKEPLGFQKIIGSIVVITGLAWFISQKNSNTKHA